MAIAITTGYLLGDALLVAYSTLPPATQRRWLGLGWEYGPISAPVSTLAHHLVGQCIAFVLDVCQGMNDWFGERVRSIGWLTRLHMWLAGALSFGLSLYFRAGYVLSAMFVATEVSTPFINARWHLHEGAWVDVA